MGYNNPQNHGWYSPLQLNIQNNQNWFTAHMESSYAWWFRTPANHQMDVEKKT